MLVPYSTVCIPTYTVYTGQQKMLCKRPKGVHHMEEWRARSEKCSTLQKRDGAHTPVPVVLIGDASFCISRR